jgi:hypothetical protein
MNDYSIEGLKIRHSEPRDLCCRIMRGSGYWYFMRLCREREAGVGMKLILADRDPRLDQGDARLE